MKRLGKFPGYLLLIPAALSLLQAQTTVTLTTTPNPSVLGAPVVLSATVTPSTANGRVTFYDGVTILGTKPLTSGVASLTTITLAGGNRRLKAYYMGDTANAAAGSNVVPQAVNARPSASFAAYPLTPVFAFTAVLMTADFNGDGKADLAIRDTNALSILLGDGGGNFQTVFSLPISNTNSLSAQPGDFNGDGIIDLALANSSIGMISILPGNGDGTFGAPLNSQLPHAVLGIAVGDFNGDGKADLVTTDAVSGVTIQLGKGDGTFQPAVSYLTNPVGSLQATFVLVADFNGDGIADLAAAGATTAVSILLGTGNGTFLPASTISVEGFPLSLAVGDFNGDGKADLATGSANILLGNGDGTFQKPVNFPAISFFAVAVGDFNGDGKADVVFADGVARVIAVLTGNGDGSFQATATYPIGANATTILAGEFNGDGRTDLVVGGSTINLLLGSTVSVTTAGTPQSTPVQTAFLNQLQVTVKNGANPVSGVLVTFTAPVGTLGLPTATLSSGTAMTDANGVAAVTATANSVTGAYVVTATVQNVSALFSLTNLAGPASGITASPAQPQSALLGAAFSRPLEVTIKDPAGALVTGMAVTFVAPGNGASAVLSRVVAVTNALGVASATAMANNTAGSYTVTASAGGLSATFQMINLQSTNVTLGASPGPWSLGAPVTLTATVANPAAAGRVTFYDGVAVLGTRPAASGTATLATMLLSAGMHKLTAYYRDDTNSVAGSSNVVTQTVNAGAVGTFTSQTPLATIPAASPIVTGDFNGDGKVDCAFSTFNSSLIVLLGKGDGTFQQPASYPVGTISTSLAAGDFNGDGNMDLAVTLATGVGILLGNGDGTFRPVVPYGALNNVIGAVSSSVRSIVAGDFNGDGKADIMVAYAATFFLPGVVDSTMESAADVVSSGTAAFTAFNLLAGNGDGTFRTPVSYGGPAFGLNFLVTDFNGDGKADLAASGDSAPVILLGNGDGTVQAPLRSTLGLAVSFNYVVMLAGDFNGDGKTDLAVGALLNAVGSVPTTWILMGKGDGTFQQAVSYALGSVVSSSDFNGDGITDLIVADISGNLRILQGRGDGTFQQGAPITARSPLAIADFNGDGRADILSVTPVIDILTAATATVWSGTSATGSLSLTATGGATQSTPVGTPFPAPLQVTLMNGGVPVSGATIGFTPSPSTGGTAVLSSPTAVTNAMGVASVTAVASSTPGSYVVTATYQGASATFSLTNTALGNLALGRTATQSSTLAGYAGAGPGSAVDGHTDGNFFNGSVTATNLEATPWWQVDLGTPATISSIVVWNRTDCCGDRLGDYWVFVSNTPFLPTDTPTTLQNRAGTFNIHLTTGNSLFTGIGVGVEGRYVRVQLSGTNYLSLAEVQVVGSSGGPAPTNLALGQPAMQSSTYPGYPSAAAGSAVDGHTDGNFFNGSVTATNLEANPWWQVDLGGSAAVTSVLVFNRTDCCSDRLSDYWVFVSDTPFLPSDTPATLQNRAGTFSSHQTTAAPAIISMNATGRYVRVQLSGTNYLSLAEVQVVGTGGAPAPTNLALGKTATQSSTLAGYPTDVALSAVDGNTDGAFFDGSVTATNSEANPWWQVDLGNSALVGSITIWNRTDACCVARLSDYWVFVSDTPFLAADTPATLQNRPGTFSIHQTTAPAPSTTVRFEAILSRGRYVRVQLSGTDYLSLAEVQVFGQ